MNSCSIKVSHCRTKNNKTKKRARKSELQWIFQSIIRQEKHVLFPKLHSEGDQKESQKKQAHLTKSPKMIQNKINHGTYEIK